MAAQLPFIYSIDIIKPNSNAPRLELREVPSDLIPHRALLCNPWLRQVKGIPKKHQFGFFGVGYDNSRPEKVYKMLGYYVGRQYHGAAIYESAPQALKCIDTPDKDWSSSETARRTNVCLNGNLYWVESNPEYFIRSFDFSTENFKPFCPLPCQKIQDLDERFLLAVYKRDGFSLLKHCDATEEVEVWVTKNKIDKEEVVVWIKLMTLPTTNFPRLSNVFYRVSYFIFDKTLFMCMDDYTSGAPSIYIVRGDMCKKIQQGFRMFPLTRDLTKSYIMKTGK
ncbi:unnamed protein product [Thlaspi arvense]|uniref:F-box associated beta-propeller type 1 domain-containing protein n=1 Tax=Thlaspi arvense TaxID=13288 RepID=A0AAU9RUM6_THLAR|nr:unnamed protein product [Thlaspi arvense]